LTPDERAATAVREGRASRKALRAAIAREIRAAVAEAAPRTAGIEALRESEARSQSFAERTRELQHALNELRAKTEERERIAHALRESEERLRAQYQGIPIPTYTWRKQGDEMVLVDYNDAANRIAAGRMAEWKGRNASGMYAERPDIVADLWRCYREHVTIRREMVYHFQTIGQDRVLSTTYAFTAPDQVVVHIEDVTERVRAEEALRASEARFRGLVECLPAIVYSAGIGPASTTEYVSPQVQQLTGYTQADYQAHPDTWRRTLHPEDRERVLAEVQRCHASGLPLDAEYRLVARDGHARWFHDSAVIVKDAQGRPLALQGVMYDITERKQAEQALRESEARYRTLVETSPDAIIMVGPDGRILLANQQTARLHGFARAEDMVGLDAAQLVAPEDRERSREDLRRLPQTGTLRGVQRTFVRKDGTPFPVEISLSAVADVDGHPLAFLGVGRDITERKKAEERERLQQEQLRQADKLAALGALVSGVAHEVSNPNHVIALNVATLRSLVPGLQSVLDRLARERGEILIGPLPYSQLRDEVPRLLDDILGASNRIKRIVSDLKEYARPDASEPFRPFQTNAAVTAAVELLRPLLHKSTRRFSMDLAPDLPHIPGRGTRIEQIVVNLLQNACQALRGPEDAIHVSSRRSADGAYVLIEVRDEGEGIPRENLARLTDPFFTTKRDHGGTGLGLAVSASIAQEHQGRLEFESAPGQGAIVRLWLPLSPGNFGDRQAVLSVPEISDQEVP
jgi:PAS domain S-box-containing protein